MDKKPTNNEAPHTVAVPLTDDELASVNRYAKAKGLKLGRWARNLMLAEVERNDAIASGRTQIDPAAFQGR